MRGVRTLATALVVALGIVLTPLFSAPAQAYTGGISTVPACSSVDTQAEADSAKMADPRMVGRERWFTSYNAQYEATPVFCRQQLSAVWSFVVTESYSREVTKESIVQLDTTVSTPYFSLRYSDGSTSYSNCGTGTTSFGIGSTTYSVLPSVSTSLVGCGIPDSAATGKTIVGVQAVMCVVDSTGSGRTSGGFPQFTNNPCSLVDGWTDNSNVQSVKASKVIIDYWVGDAIGPDGQPLYPDAGPRPVIPEDLAAPVDPTQDGSSNDANPNDDRQSLADCGFDLLKLSEWVECVFVPKGWDSDGKLAEAMTSSDVKEVGDSLSKLVPVPQCGEVVVADLGHTRVPGTGWNYNFSIPEAKIDTCVFQDMIPQAIRDMIVAIICVGLVLLIIRQVRWAIDAVPDDAFPENAGRRK